MPLIICSDIPVWVVSPLSFILLHPSGWRISLVGHFLFLLCVVNLLHGRDMWDWYIRAYGSLIYFLFLTWVLLKQVLLGESPGCELENSFPSKAGLLTVLEVLKIQMKFWLSLGPIFVNLESQWRMYCFQKKSKELPLVYLLNLTTLFLLDIVLLFISLD